MTRSIADRSGPRQDLGSVFSQSLGRLRSLPSLTAGAAGGADVPDAVDGGGAGAGLPAGFAGGARRYAGGARRFTEGVAVRGALPAAGPQDRGPVRRLRAVLVVLLSGLVVQRQDLLHILSQRLSTA